MNIYLREGEKIFINEELITIDKSGSYSLSDNKIIYNEPKELSPRQRKRYMTVGDIEDEKYLNENVF